MFGHVGLLEAYFDGESTSRAACRARSPPAWQAAFDRRRASFSCIRNRWHEFPHSQSARAQARKRNARLPLRAAARVLPLWLDDPLMLYTCAYWKDGTRTLEEAQRNKMRPRGRKVLLERRRRRGRRRLRLRRLHVPRAGALRRQGHRRSTPPARRSSMRGARSSAARPGEQLRVVERRLPRAWPAQYDKVRLDRHASSTPGATSSPT